MGKNRSNDYCDVCKRIHRKGKCTELTIGDKNKFTPAAAKALMLRANMGRYLSRDRIDDDKNFIESGIVKEVDDDESKRKRNNE